MLKLFKRAIAALGIATLSIGAGPAAAPPAAHPALWEVSGSGGTVYLFGTIHLLPPNYQWETPTIEHAVSSSDQLYVETIVDPDHPQGIIDAMRTLGYASGLPPLADRVAPSKRQALEAAIAETGLPRPVWDKMKTWMAAFLLMGVQYKQLGLAGEAGPEITLRQQFATAGKQVGQLETNAEQLGFFNALPETAQRALLDSALEKPQAMSNDFWPMLRAWANGDVSGIARTFNHDLADSPALMDALLKHRNANWKSWIEQRLASRGTVLLAVGAGHLAGSGSLVSLLQRDGYRVRRIE